MGREVGNDVPTGHEFVADAFEDGALGRMITEYTREAGVRSLERQIGAGVKRIQVT